MKMNHIVAGAVALALYPTAHAAQVFVTDLVVQGSECVGFDCVSSESFGFDTLRLKENNLRIHFNDTSNSGSFPTADWRIVANDTGNGGSNYLAFEDSDAGTQPFRVNQGAGNNALYVDAQGDVGLNTSNPVVELHIADGDSPTLRLEQNASAGFTPQTWDVAGNETNFFVRDVTNGSELPFKILPGADDNSLYINSDNKIGLGTNLPKAQLHVVGTGGGLLVSQSSAAPASQAYVHAYGTDGNTAFKVEEASTTKSKRDLLVLKNNGNARIALINHDNDTWRIGTAGGKSLRFGEDSVGDAFTFYSTGAASFVSVSTSTELLKLEADGNLTIAGTLTQNSDRDTKTRIVPVETDQILAKLRALPIATWTLKRDDTGAVHLGPMAQDFYAAFGLGSSERKIAPIDVAGVAIAGLQGLSDQLAVKAARIAELERRLADLEHLIGGTSLKTGQDETVALLQ